MKTELVLKKMMLLGFMLMAVSINVFANNANGKKDTADVVAEKTVSRSTIERYEDPITIIFNNNGSQVITPVDVEGPMGYRYDDCIIEEGSCIEEYNGNMRDLIVRIIARYRGRTILKLRFVALEGGSNTIIINIEVNVI